jgi:hypothetical protein
VFDDEEWANLQRSIADRHFRVRRNDLQRRIEDDQGRPVWRWHEELGWCTFGALFQHCSEVNGETEADCLKVWANDCWMDKWELSGLKDIQRKLHEKNQKGKSISFTQVHVREMLFPFWFFSCSFL